jgi:hypothetical protein
VDKVRVKSLPRATGCHGTHIGEHELLEQFPGRIVKGAGNEEHNAPCVTRERIELLIEIAKLQAPNALWLSGAGHNFFPPRRHRTASTGTRHVDKRREAGEKSQYGHLTLFFWFAVVSFRSEVIILRMGPFHADLGLAGLIRRIYRKTGPLLI